MGNELVELQPIPYFPWKGQTFNQITSALKKNTYTLNQNDTRNIFKPHPVKLYRKEIASTHITSGNPRVSASIDDFNMPNGYIISNNLATAICNTLDINRSTNKYDLGNAIQLSDNPKVCFSQADNAKRRLRSGGMIKKYNIDDRKKNYYTSNTQYLYDRNETFEQNQFKYSVSDPSCNTPVVKPNNSKFKTQGGVSSGDLIARKKYDTITDSASKFRSAYGNDVANALAYSSNSSTYTIKDKIGYPLKRTPVFSKYSEEMQKCYITKISNEI
jgi:hypothetical protein